MPSEGVKTLSYQMLRMISCKDVKIIFVLEEDTDQLSEYKTDGELRSHHLKGKILKVF